MKLIIIKMLIPFIVGLVISAGAVMSCKSFDVIQIEGQPDECNDFYTVMKYYSVEGKDSAFVGTVYQECKSARAEIRKQTKEKHCAKIIFPEGLDKKQHEKYMHYLECIK